MQLLLILLGLGHWAAAFVGKCIIPPSSQFGIFLRDVSSCDIANRRKLWQVLAYHRPT